MEIRPDQASPRSRPRKSSRVRLGNEFKPHPAEDWIIMASPGQNLQPQRRPNTRGTLIMLSTMLLKTRDAFISGAQR